MQIRIRTCESILVLQTQQAKRIASPASRVTWNRQTSSNRGNTVAGSNRRTKRRNHTSEVGGKHERTAKNRDGNWRHCGRSSGSDVGGSEDRARCVLGARHGGKHTQESSAGSGSNGIQSELYIRVIQSVRRLYNLQRSLARRHNQLNSIHYPCWRRIRDHGCELDNGVRKRYRHLVHQVCWRRRCSSAGCHQQRPPDGPLYVSFHLHRRDRLSHRWTKRQSEKRPCGCATADAVSLGRFKQWRIYPGSNSARVSRSLIQNELQAYRLVGIDFDLKREL